MLNAFSGRIRLPFSRILKITKKMKTFCATWRAKVIFFLKVKTFF